MKGGCQAGEKQWGDEEEEECTGKGWPQFCVFWVLPQLCLLQQNTSHIKESHLERQGRRSRGKRSLAAQKHWGTSSFCTVCVVFWISLLHQTWCHNENHVLSLVTKQSYNNNTTPGGSGMWSKWSQTHELLGFLVHFNQTMWSLSKVELRYRRAESLACERVSWWFCSESSLPVHVLTWNAKAWEQGEHTSPLNHVFI